MDIKNTSIFRVIFVLIIGLLFAFAVGNGISAFYPQPQPPLTSPISYPQGTSNNSEFQAMNNYNDEIKVYDRNVALISLAIAILTIVISFLLVNVASVIKGGVLMGGVFTLIYSIAQGLNTNDAKLRFIISLVALLVIFATGYFTFFKENRQSL